MIRKAMLVDRQEGKRAAWLDQFTAFCPNGPESEDYLLIVCTPDWSASNGKLFSEQWLGEN